MRIRSIKPEFLSGTDYALPRLVYAGLIGAPTTWRSICEPRWLARFVYHFFDKDGELLYVGMTWSPHVRWSAHRLKAKWWHEVAYVHLHEVIGRDAFAADMGARDFEARAIRGGLPLRNLHGPANLPAKEAVPSAPYSHHQA